MGHSGLNIIHEKRDRLRITHTLKYRDLNLRRSSQAQKKIKEINGI